MYALIKTREIVMGCRIIVSENGVFQRRYGYEMKLMIAMY